MRLFLTSFQKSGTHQIMPALHISPDIVDRSYNSLRNAPEKWQVMRDLPKDGIEDTCEKLRTFKNESFGHVAYLPEYADAVQAEPTKVLFNVRDPRDVIVSEYFSILKIISSGKGKGFPNLFSSDGRYLIEHDDPIQELIELDATRWPLWLGWLDHDFTRMVRYEDLRLNGLEELIKIRDWLMPYQINVDSCQIRLSPAKDNPTFRRGIVGEWKEVFKSHHRELAENLLGGVISRLGYEI